MNNVEKLIKRTYNASFSLQAAADTQVKKALLHLSRLLVEKSPALIRANKKDLAKQAPDDSKKDRLLLNEERIRNIANAIKIIASLPCPAGQLLDEKVLKNGLRLQRHTAPLGVVGVIYESRPNVTFDIAALCLRSKNACLLKGSRDAEETNKAAVAIIKTALKENGLPTDCVTLLPSEREVLQQVFTATKYIDVIIPRGSAGLIAHVRQNSLVPTIETGAGVCHIYVEKEADINKAVNIVVNAKVSRPTVCNAVDTVLVDKSIAEDFFEKLLPGFAQHSVKIFAEPKASAFLKGYPYLQKATPESFGHEYLSLQCSVKVVQGLEEAMAHIREHSTRHSEAIVSENKKQCSRFIQGVDAAVVYANASTRFTDGEEFGLGAEIGISTQKLHARGPFALEKLVTEKWIALGNGQVR
ncbi:MAG TPA: glutamate-5-semialdehyde dehydrogenase [Flavisolibacter sp.]|jgi:glutamate-5-semialdehyde dehydrogenase|nr:glutamate-5-semialdehyde dehydrogenase [Flavisolibacter sp.]